jgi:hypothetical protein
MITARSSPGSNYSLSRILTVQPSIEKKIKEEEDISKGRPTWTLEGGFQHAIGFPLVPAVISTQNRWLST